MESEQSFRPVRCTVVPAADSIGCILLFFDSVVLGLFAGRDDRDGHCCSSKNARNKNSGHVLSPFFLIFKSSFCSFLHPGSAADDGGHSDRGCGKNTCNKNSSHGISPPFSCPAEALAPVDTHTIPQNAAEMFDLSFLTCFL